MAMPPVSIMAQYRQGSEQGFEDGRLFAPTFPRNSPPLISELAPWLNGRKGTVLEIGAGTGQHATAFALAFRGLDWWPSDPDPLHRASVEAWQKALGAPLRPAFDLDAATDWAALPEVEALAPLAAVLSMNVIHIAPFEVATGIVLGAGKALAQDGILILYGPFKENGAHTGAGNEAFDARLRSENPDWGIRDSTEIAALADQAGLRQVAFVSMPANNRLIIFQK
ncbi:MAG: class I SAM-dependent methyltransferase [Paracoccaceae bacterium]|nr:class I SAM-dependent methyltransferase [Paracoccaceae bacterium]